MERRCFIGIDVGTSGCKILALGEDGKILGTAVEEYPLYSPQPGWSEQEPEDWWNGVVKGLRRVLVRLKDWTVSGVGFSGQMHGMVALDENYQVIRRAILWNDQRTEKQCEEITRIAGGLDSLLAATNNRMLTGFTGGKILWMKENEPENYQKTRLILNPKDYIRFRLSGVALPEVSDASGTGFFDVRNRRWAEGLMEKVGVSPSLFPKVVESTEEAGRVSAQAAAETGLPEGTLLSAGGGDAVISTTGLGLIRPGRIGITLGTSGVVAMGCPGSWKIPAVCFRSPATTPPIPGTLWGLPWRPRVLTSGSGILWGRWKRNRRRLLERARLPCWTMRLRRFPRERTDLFFCRI